MEVAESEDEDPLPGPPPLPDKASAALFLDFDGTLVEIAPRPDAIEVPARLFPLLTRLHQELDGALALVSGRALADIERHLPDFPGDIAAGHGAEFRIDGVRQAGHAAPREMLDEIAAELNALAGEVPGLLVEEKATGVVLHYRGAPDARDRARDAVEVYLDRLPGYALQTAHMAFELRPEAATKDAALTRLMASAPYVGRRPVFAGDDDTDEPALRHAMSMGGVGIRIGTRDSSVPWTLPGPAALIDLLEEW